MCLLVRHRALLWTVTSHFYFLTIDCLGGEREEHTAVSTAGNSICLVSSMLQPVSDLLFPNSAWDALHSFPVWKKKSAYSSKQNSSITSFLRAAHLPQPSRTLLSLLSSLWHQTVPGWRLSPYASLGYMQISPSYKRRSSSKAKTLFSLLVYLQGLTEYLSSA